jgi:hypothetical protein
LLLSLVVSFLARSFRAPDSCCPTALVSLARQEWACVDPASSAACSRSSRQQSSDFGLLLSVFLWSFSLQQVTHGQIPAACLSAPGSFTPLILFSR